MLLPPPKVLLASVAFLLIFRGQAMRAGDAPPEPRIRILNHEDGETIRYPVVLLRGTLDGKPILQTLALRPAQPDEDVVTADLEPGENRVLVEVSQADGGWGLFFRLEDEEGKKLEVAESGTLQPIDGR